MRKIILLLVLLVSFTSCDVKQHKKTKLHTYLTTNDDGDLYWYVFYGQNNSVYYCNSRIPLDVFLDVDWTIADSKPQQLAEAKELEVTELEDVNLENDAIEEAVDESPEATNDTDSNTDSSSDGGDGGGE